MNMTFAPEWTGGLKLGQSHELSKSDKDLAARIYPK